MPRIAYFVHDLLDPAVARRVRMLRAGGAEVDLYGFRRGDPPAGTIASVPYHDLGRTADGRLVDRALRTVAAVAGAGRLPSRLRQADAFLGRNLEMLAVAARARALFAPHAPLTYELLDVHTRLTGSGAPARLLRALEGRLLRGCRAVLTSSPAFEREYLHRHHPGHPAVLLVENKVFEEHDADGAAQSVGARPAGPPWRIGWFGVLRCRRSLALLAAVARQHPGLIEVDLRGRISAAGQEDVEAVVRDTPGFRFLGPYQNPQDLPAIYGAVHFAWAMDFFEAGLNSSWLLPNRLYEGPRSGAVPIALASVETGRWLQNHALGLVLEEPLETTLPAALAAMTPARYAALATGVRQADASLFRSGPEEARALVAGLMGASAASPR